MSKKNSQLVYSTDQGRICPGCLRPAAECLCKKSHPTLNNDGIVRISRQTKGRKGAGVTIIDGIPLDENELKILAKELKKKCGVGGAIKSGVIEIQGDQRQIIKSLLEDRFDWNIKLSGG